MGGRRNGLIRNPDDSDNDTDSSEEEAMEEMIDAYEFRLAMEQRKRELLQELSRRKGAMKRFIEELNENWNDLMKPIPVSDDELNEAGKVSTNEESNSNTNSSTSSDDSEPKKKRWFKKSTALLMYEWARNKPEYEEERERYRQQQSYYSEENIERLAFFRFSAKNNAEDRIKSENYQKERQKEWDVMKKQKREEMKNVDEELFKKWSRTEYERRQKEDKIKRKQEVEKMRKKYLGDREDEYYYDIL